MGDGITVNRTALWQYGTVDLCEVGITMAAYKTKIIGFEILYFHLS
jgi:hypothetical protein